MKKTFLLLFGAVLAGIFAGCETPVVSIRHSLPADVPLAAESLAVSDFTVAGDGDEQYGRDYAKQLADELNEANSREAHVATGDKDGLHGIIEYSVTEHSGSRKLRYWDASTGQLETKKVPTLRRDVDLRVVHLVTPEADAPEARVETTAMYTSAADPRTRGDSGLLRGDRPEAIPSGQEILDELLATSAERFAMMVHRRELSADIPLRPAAGKDTVAGFEAAEKRDFEAAVQHFSNALARSGENPNLLFNLAVAEEAAGLYGDSLEHYEAVLQKRADDEIAREAVKRLRRLIACREHQKILQSRKSQLKR